MRKPDVRRYAPVVVILLLVAVPLAVWAATSGGSGDNKKGLIVERAVGLTGEAELVLSITGDVEVTSARDYVRFQCTGADGSVVMKGTQPWPFIEEPGFPYAHVHVTDKPEKVAGARRCKVLGTNAHLEASVQ